NVPWRKEKGVVDGNGGSGEMGSDPSHEAGRKRHDDSCCAGGVRPHFSAAPHSRLRPLFPFANCRYNFVHGDVLEPWFPNNAATAAERAPDTWICRTEQRNRGTSEI